MRAHSSKKMLVFAMAVALGLVGCASGGGGGSDRPSGASSTRIVRAELEPLGDISALRAIERLRPRWLRTRAAIGETPVLYVDGSRRGDVQQLSSLRAIEIEEMRYMSGSDATTRYGTGHSGGAILVTTAR